MPAQVTTRAQVNGYRFLIRRLEHALIRADSRMIHDPMRGQVRSLLVGLVVGALIAGAAGVLAVFKPVPNLGDAQILLSKSNSAMFVRIGDHVHPVLNLASARLIVGKNEQPKQVGDKFLNQLPLGPMVGIVGAPTSINASDDLSMSSWAVCDTFTTPKVTDTAGAVSIETTVLANDPVLTDAIHGAAPSEMILAQSEGTVFLIYEGVRAPVEATNPVLLSALHLKGAEPRPMSPGLLNSIPLVDPIVSVSIPGAGDDTDYLDPRYPIGSILKASDSRGDQLYVVLREGLQLISEATADVIRYSGGQHAGGQQSQVVPPSLISQAPVVHSLHVDHYPTASPRIVNLEPDRVTCLAWQRANNAGSASTRLLVGQRLPLPPQTEPVRLATADGAGPGLDMVVLRPGTGEYIQATGVAPGSRAMGQLFYVSDTGLRFHIEDLQSAAALGVTGVKDRSGTHDIPQFAPWPVISLLPPGPELSQEAALIAHDGIAADLHGTTVEQPKG